MKKIISTLCTLAILLAMLSFAAVPALAEAPDDALFYADFNNGPMAEPEQSMQATDGGGSLYINNGPINAQASLVDGALKLTLGTSGYYGMNNTQVTLRDPEGNLTAYQYLVIRMKGEYGTENTPGAGGLMMSIGGGDGPHMGTFVSSGDVPPFLDPDGCYMPLITTEYQDFVIALSQSNVRVNEGKLVSGINFNNSVGSVTIYIDEIYLTNEIPAGFVSSGKKPGSGGTGEVPEGPSDTVPLPIGGGSSTVAQNLVVPGSSSSILSLPVIIVLLVLVIVNLAVLLLALVKITALPKKGKNDP